VVGAHHRDLQCQRILTEHRRVDVESPGVRGGQLGTVGADDVAPAPRIVDPRQLSGEVATTVREAQLQVHRQPLERAGQDQRHDREVGLRRHSHEPGQHVLRHAVGRHRVPRVHEDRDAVVGAVVEESQQRGIVEVASVDVVADVDADVSDRHRP
jgi:hypothetical protein